MSYPPPNFDQYALNGYKFARLNTPLISDGDIYESQQGAQGFAIGPDSDISKVNIAYFDDQVPRFMNQVAITPERSFPGFFAARNEVDYVPSNRPGRILIWSDELYNNTWLPTAFEVGSRIDFEVPVLDVIQYFAPAAQAMNSGRNDKEYWYDFISPPFVGPILATGTGDSLTGPVGVTMTLTDAAASFADPPIVPGTPITISGSSNPANNGVFFVQSVLGPTQLTFNNVGGGPVTEAFTWKIGGGVGPTSWTIVIPWYGRRFADLHWQNNQPVSVDVSVNGLHFKPGDNNTAATQTPLIDDGLPKGGAKFVTVGPFGDQVNAVITASNKSDGGSVTVIGDRAKPIFQVNAGMYDALAFTFYSGNIMPIDPTIPCTLRIRTSDRGNG